jgi:hypothetical protein
MSSLVVDAIAVAVDEKPNYLVAAELEDANLREMAKVIAGLGVAPFERLAMLADTTDGSDVSARALAAMGPPAAPHQLYFVRSGPDADPFVAMLPRLVHHLGWVTEDFGITHLDELGGTSVLELLSWAADPGSGSTAVVVDEPVFADADALPPSLSAVALRVHSGTGPVRVLSWGEGAPGTDGVSHVFAGRGPCDSWIGLHAALRTGVVADGDRVLLHACGGREGWALLDIADAQGVELGARDDD